MHARGLIPVAAALLIAAAPGPSLDLQPPRLTRSQMEVTSPDRAAWLFVYGTRDPAATPALRERARAIAGRLFGSDTSRVKADRAIGERELSGGPVFLLGGPRENDWTRRLEPALPVRFTPQGFQWFGRTYDLPGDVIHLVFANPLAPRRFLLLVAGNTTAAETRRGGGFFFGAEDWRIYRDGALVRFGSFAQTPAGPWRYDPALDHDRDRDRERFVSGLRRVPRPGLDLLAPADVATDAVAAEGEVLLALMGGRGFDAPRARPLSLTLYHDLEEKGGLTRDTRPEHLDDAGRAHAAPAAGRARLDLWSVAAARFVSLGASGRSRFLEPAAVWMAGRFEGEPLDRVMARLYFGRILPTAEQAATRDPRWRSALVWTPCRALLARAVFESAQRRGRPARDALLSLLREDPPGSLDSLCRAARVEPGRVARRYAALGDSLARAGVRRVSSRRPRPWKAEDGFQRGVCLAHAMSLGEGYLSEACGRELARLQAAGVNWVSLTPFAYLPSPESPEIYPSAEGGVDEESDEAVCEAAARARAIGMRVWLKPHLWTRGWVGHLEFGPSGWPRFFDAYRQYILHCALLAEREGMDGLVIGHELPTATAGFEDRWRELISQVRRVYSGTLAYDAHWQEEAGRIGFWDALDVIGVSFYAPLAARPTTSRRVLFDGAERAVEPLRELALRWHRPVVLLEVGYAATPDAAARPWEEPRGDTDPGAQRACYEAMVHALAGEEWIGGVFWWKWFSGETRVGAGEHSFSPQGEPAEAVLRQAFKDWRTRPVRLPAR